MDVDIKNRFCQELSVLKFYHPMAIGIGGVAIPTVRGACACLRVVFGTVIFCAVVVVIAARQCVNGYTVVTVVGAGHRRTIGVYEIVHTVIIIKTVVRWCWFVVCARCPIA